MSSFIQRTYDQLSQDLALNNSAATILVYCGAISSMDATHLGVFDIPLISNIPNIVYLAPTNKEEYLAMLNWAYNQNEHPSVIRVPSVPLKSTGVQDLTDYSKLNKYKMINQGEKIAIIALGSFFNLGENIQNKLKNEFNINATLINPCYITGIDEDMLNNLKQNHDLIITLEDGLLDGGFGEKISRFYSTSNMKVKNYGAKKIFTDRAPLNKLYEMFHLTEDQLINDIEELIQLTFVSKIMHRIS